MMGKPHAFSFLVRTLPARVPIFCVKLHKALILNFSGEALNWRVLISGSPFRTDV